MIRRIEFTVVFKKLLTLGIANEGGLKQAGIFRSRNEFQNRPFAAFFAAFLE